MNLIKSHFFVLIMSFTTCSLRAADMDRSKKPISLGEFPKDTATDTTLPTEDDFLNKFLVKTVMENFGNRGRIPSGSDPFQNGTEYVSLDGITDIKEQHDTEYFPLKTTTDREERAPKKRKFSSPDESAQKTRKIRVVDDPQKKIAELSEELKMARIKNEDLRNDLKKETALSKDRETALSIVREEAEKRKLEYKDLGGRLLREKLECKELKDKCEKLEDKCKRLELKVQNLHNENDALRELNAKGTLIEEGEIVEKGE